MAEVFNGLVSGSEEKFDAIEAAEAFVASLVDPVDSRCPKICFVPKCALRDEPGSPEAKDGCPLQLDDDGLSLGGAY